MKFEDARALLGKRVKVTLAYPAMDEEIGTPNTIAVGTLVGFGDGGDFEILEDDGFLHYCWPMLEVEEIE